MLSAPSERHTGGKTIITALIVSRFRTLAFENPHILMWQEDIPGHGKRSDLVHCCTRKGIHFKKKYMDTVKTTPFFHALSIGNAKTVILMVHYAEKFLHDDLKKNLETGRKLRSIASAAVLSKPLSLDLPLESEDKIGRRAKNKQYRVRSGSASAPSLY
jgi:hypothetical protein